MAVRDYVPIQVDDLPETFDYDLDNATYTFTIDYNEAGDFFTVTLDDVNGNRLVTNEKMILDQPLFVDLVDDRLPNTPLVPMDESGQVTRVSITNFGDTVQLYEDTIDPDFSDADTLPTDQDWGDMD